jgi:type I restriction enzyme S subunit
MPLPFILHPSTFILTMTPPGYKQTEVGVIPDDWDVVKLGDLIEYTKGYPFRSDEYAKDGVRIVRVSDTSYDSILEENPIFIPENKARQYAKWRLRTDDLIISTVGSKPPMYDSMVGKVILISQQNEGALLNQNAVLIRDKKKRAYVQQILLTHCRSKRYLTWIESIFRGNANQASITLKELFEFPVPFPDTDVEQRAIATALSDVDALLAALDRLIAKQRDLKPAAMQQLLTGQTRLPGFTGKWETKRLGEIAEMGSGGTPPSSVSSYYDGDIPWVSISDMTSGGKVIMSTDRNLTRSGFTNSAAQMFPVGTVLYAMYASLGECSVAGIPLCTSQAILGIRPKDRLDGEFLYYYLTSLKAFVKSLGQQGTQSNLNKGMVQDFRLSLPPLPEQTAIATVLSDMDAELAALEQRRDKTRALKQGMMQELLTGRTRLV